MEVKQIINHDKRLRENINVVNLVARYGLLQFSLITDTKKLS